MFANPNKLINRKSRLVDGRRGDGGGGMNQTYVGWVFKRVSCDCGFEQTGRTMGRQFKRWPRPLGIVQYRSKINVPTKNIPMSYVATEWRLVNELYGIACAMSDLLIHKMLATSHPEPDRRERVHQVTRAARWL